MREDWLSETPVFNEAFVWLSSSLAANSHLLYQWDLALILSVALVLYLTTALQRIDIVGGRPEKKPRIALVVGSDGRHDAFNTLKRSSSSDGRLKKSFMSGELGDGRQLSVLHPSTSVSLPLLTVSADDLYQVPFDLNNYRRRIDAGVEEQRRQREILEGLQDKVLKCRLKSAESRTADSKGSKLSLGEQEYPLVPFSLIHEASTSKSIGFARNISSSSPGLHLVESSVGYPRATSTPNRNVDNIHHHSSSSTRLIQKEYGDYEDTHNFGEQLRNEQLRNLFLEEMVESLRHQVEATLGSNEVLSADIVHLSECLQRESFARREDAGIAADRTMKQKRLVDVFHQRLHELWIEFCALKRKVNDARNDVSFDLATQKSEFLRLRKTLEILVGQTKSVHQSRQQNTSKEHEEAMEEIVRKYEEVVRRNAEIELEKDNFARESSKLESNLSRTNEEKEGLENVLERIHRLPEVKYMLAKRTRSGSPDVRESSSPSLRHASVLADVRTAFKLQTSEAESFKRKYEQANYKQKELESQISQLEMNLREAQSLQSAEKSAHQETKSDTDRLKRQHATLKEKVEMFEADRTSMQSTLEAVNQKIMELQSEQESLILQHREEKHELVEQLQRQSIQQPSCKRCPHLEAENERLRSQQQGYREEHNSLRQELQEEKHRSVETERKLMECKQEERLTREKMYSLAQQYEDKEIYCADLEKEVDEARKRVTDMERASQQYLVEKMWTISENNKLTEQISSLKMQSSQYCSQLQQSREQVQRDVEKWQEKLESLEKMVNAQTTTIKDMAMKIEIGEEQKNALQKELEDNEEEFSRNLKLITQLTNLKTFAERKSAASLAEFELLQNAFRDEQREKEQISRRMAEYEQLLRTSQEEKEMCSTSERNKSIQLREMTSELALIKDKLAETKLKLDTQLEINKQQNERTDELWNIEMGRLKKEHKAELYRVQSTNISTQTRLEQLQKEHVANDEKHKMIEDSLKNTTEKQQRAEKMLRSELDMLQHKYNEQFVQLSDSQERVSKKEETIAELQQQLEDTKILIGDGLKREENLENKLQEAENRIAKSAQMIQKLYSDLEEMSEQSESLSLQAETELVKMRLETTRLSEEKMAISQELDLQLRKNIELEQNLRLAEANAQEQEAQLISVQQTLQHTKEEKQKIVVQFQEVEANLQTQVREAHKEVEVLQEGNSTTEKAYQDAHAEHRSLEAKIQELEQKRNQQQKELENTVVEKNKLNLQLKNVSKDLALSKDIVCKLQVNEKHMHRRLEEQREKTQNFEKTLIELRSNYKAASEDLKEMREKYATRKACVDKAVMVQLSEPVDALTLQHFKEKNEEIEMQRDRINDLEQKQSLEVSQGQTKIYDLRRQLESYEEIAGRAVIFARNFSSQSLESSLSSFSFGDDEPGSSNNIFVKEKPSTSTFTMSGLIDVHPEFSRINEGKMKQEGMLDHRTSVDVAFQILKTKIIEMDNELQQKIGAFQRLKSESSHNRQELEEANSKLHDLHKTIRSLQEEKNSLDIRLTSANQILLTQAEHLASNESEKQNFKVKLMSAEMHTRDKEARIKMLQDQLKTGQNHLEDEKQQHKKRESNWKDERLTMENDLDDYRRRMEQLRLEKDKIESEKEIFKSRVNTLEQRYSSLQQKSSEFDKSIGEYQELVNRLQKEQSEWKSTTYRVESLNKTTVDYQQTKTALDAMTVKWKSVEQEREQIRRELLDVRSKLTTATIKINNLKSVVSDLNSEKKISLERIEVFERAQRDSSLANREKSRQLEQLQSERLILVAEVEDLKRQLVRLETGKREYEMQISRMRREVETHKNHVEALEMDKRRVEGVIRQTMMERQALDKSLGAMEKENTELYRNCSILQNQLSQLEQENNSRSTEINNRTKMKMEAEINRLNQEKRQLEKLLNQREQNYEQKEKMLDNQIRDLQQQVEAEKRKKRQFPCPDLPGPSTPSISTEHHYTAIRRTNISRKSVDLTRLQKAPFRP